MYNCTIVVGVRGGVFEYEGQGICGCANRRFQDIDVWCLPHPSLKIERGLLMTQTQGSGFNIEVSILRRLE